jgi:manganese efflux pump family protein
MDWSELISLFFIALSLSADCFAVSLGGGCSLPDLRYVRILRTSLAFGLAQAVMPALGWLVGRFIINYIAAFDHWIVFGLLVVVGGRMIWEGAKSDSKEKEGLDITRGWLLLTMAVVTSIDALAVGLGLAFIKTHIAPTVLMIGVVAFLMSNLGFYIGSKTGDLLGKRARIIGGVILIAIGLRILISHLLG